MNGINVCNPKKITLVITTLVLTWLLNGCGGSDATPSGVNDSGVNSTESPTYSIGGIVTGLTGSGLELQNNGDSLPISSNGSFTFTTALAEGESYNVTISVQPSEQECSVNLGSGIQPLDGMDYIEVHCTFAVTVSANKPNVLTFSWADQGAHYYTLLKDDNGTGGGVGVGDYIYTTSVDEKISVHLHNWLNASYRVRSCDINDVCITSAEVSTASAMIDAIGYFKASNTEAADRFGYNVALSADGLTMAITATRESSHADGIDGDQTDNTGGHAGAVYVFSRTSTGWTQQAYIKASNSGVFDYFGNSLDLSADGNTLAVGAYGEGSANGDQADNSADYAGAVYVFGRSGTTWTQHAYLKASNIGEGDNFGYSLSLAANGNTLAVGAHNEESGDGNQADNTEIASGAVYVFTRSGISWTQQAYLKASTIEMGDFFGMSLAIDSDGDTLAIGAEGEDSAAMGVNGDQSDNTENSAGAVYVFTHNGTVWSQQAYLKASNAEAYDVFGANLDISNDGNTLAASAFGEDSSATGENGNQINNFAEGAGAVYIFERTGTSWSQQTYLKASNTEAGDTFGTSLAITADGNGLAVGARGEKSFTTGINGEQWNDGVAGGAGAAYYFIRGANWGQKAYIKASNTGVIDSFASSLAISSDGSTLAVGAYGEESSATGINGNQADDSQSYSGAVYLY